MSIFSKEKQDEILKILACIKYCATTENYLNKMDVDAELAIQLGYLVAACEPRLGKDLIGSMRQIISAIKQPLSSVVEQLPYKEQVVRSNRTGATICIHCDHTSDDHDDEGHCQMCSCTVHEISVESFEGLIKSGDVKVETTPPIRNPHNHDPIVTCLQCWYCGPPYMGLPTHNHCDYGDSCDHCFTCEKTS